MDLKFTTAGDFLQSQQKRIGFACKYMHPDQTQKKKLLEEIQRPLNTILFRDILLCPPIDSVVRYPVTIAAGIIKTPKIDAMYAAESRWEWTLDGSSSPNAGNNDEIEQIMVPKVAIANAPTTISVEIT